jgi:hypothetical protein
MLEFQCPQKVQWRKQHHTRTAEAIVGCGKARAFGGVDPSVSADPEGCASVIRALAQSKGILMQAECKEGFGSPGEREGALT